ncbi:Uncharacterized protein family UPF0497 [Macleaya cordata]|uniref:CASP-like protein n=1 Tax=Macleaya cordata TaxID=56857 RepID=A0A200QDJ8_MACCD|nr:Uncharacterized protein family UPF0497 [Macleaya cordata]
MMNGQKTTPEVGIQMPESKVVAAESATMSGPLVSAGHSRNIGRKTDIIHTTLRLVCLFSSVMAVSFMATAEEKATISIYGFHLPVYCKWSFADSFEYLVGMSAAVVAHSLLQLILSVVKLIKKTPVIPSRNHAWLIFAGDQIFAYAMMSAGSAASGVTNLNRTGIRHSVLPDFCKPLHRFCDRIAVSISFTFLSCFLLATSAVLDVIWLSKY